MCQLPDNAGQFARLPQTALDRAHEIAVLSERCQTVAEHLAGHGHSGKLGPATALILARGVLSDARHVVDAAERMVADLVEHADAHPGRGPADDWEADDA